MESDVYIFPEMQYDETFIYNKIASLTIFERIHPGQKIVLKPNWVQEAHSKRKKDFDYVITHPTVITAVLRIVSERLEGNGKISIIDAPMTGASFEKILRHYPIDRWRETVGKISFEIIDLRDVAWRSVNGIILSSKELPGDPLGSVTVNLENQASEFDKFVPENGFFGASNDIRETNYAHSQGRHLYKVSKTAIECDVFINLPKLKTHQKAGITCSLKNLVGINTYKNYLPHHTIGTPQNGGDQYPDDTLSNRAEAASVNIIKRLMHRSGLFSFCMIPVKSLITFIRGKKTVRAGSWYGNNTLWRMILDLNKILFYSDHNGKMTENKKINYISIVDGIIGGDGNGPLYPNRVDSGILVCGSNPVSVDCVCATLMGFSPDKIPHLSNAFKIQHYRLAESELQDIRVNIRDNLFNLDVIPNEFITKFKPATGWVGQIEKHMNDF